MNGKIEFAAPTSLRFVGGDSLNNDGKANCESGAPLPSDPVRISPDHFRAELIIVNEMGLHARPASMLVATCNRFDCDIKLTRGGETVDAKSILQLLSLAAEAGTKLILEAKGPDAESATKAIVELVSSGFQELDSN